MIMSLGSLDLRTNSSPLRSTSKLSVRNVAAGFESFSRNHAEHAFSVCRISRTLSRARRIFCPCLPLAARSPRIRSRGGLHPARARLAESHGFTGRALTGAVSQGEFESPVAGVAALGLESAESAVQRVRLTCRLASGRGSAT